MAVAFDTLAQAKRLREAGFDEKQAETLAVALRGAAGSFDLSELATKAGVAALEAKVAIKAELAALEAKVAAHIAEAKADVLQWMIGLVAGAVVLNAFVVIGSMMGLAKLLGH